MAVVTAAQVVGYTDISASAATVAASGLIPVVQERIKVITNNEFAVADLSLTGAVTFNATARTIVSTGGDYAANGIAAGDEVYVYGSYRNDGYYTVGSVSTATITLATGESVVDELSGASVIVATVRWPSDVAYIAAQMVKFDYDDRGKREGGAISRSLGPYSETFGEGGLSYGYPEPVINALSPYTMVRMA